MYSFYANGWQLWSAIPTTWDKNDPREMAFVADKKLSIQTHKAYMLSRLAQMFEYKNLPESIPAEMLELQLILSGVSFVREVNGKLYALQGSPGGEPDPYYRPTRFVWANPALGSGDDDLWNDGVLMRNDKYWFGLSPLINKYAAILAENEITIRLADIMLRIVAMITTPDDTTKIAADEYLKRIVNGRIGSMAENRFFDGVKMQSPPSNNGSYLTQFIELQQYMKASFFNEVGMQANYNMKRENIGSGETAMNQNATLPLCDQMLEVRREDVSRLNEKYGLDISIDFTSAWKLNAEQLKMEVDQLKAELAVTKAEAEASRLANKQTKENQNAAESMENQNDDFSGGDNPESPEGSDAGRVPPAEEHTAEDVNEENSDGNSTSDAESESEGGDDSAEVGGEPSAEVNVTLVVGDGNEVSGLNDSDDSDSADSGGADNSGDDETVEDGGDGDDDSEDGGSDSSDTADDLSDTDDNGSSDEDEE